MITVGILYGGRSGEHDVSCCSAASVVSHLDMSRYNVVAVGIDVDGKWYVQDKPAIVDDKDFGKKLKIEKTGHWLVNHYEEENRLTFYRQGSGEKVSVDVVFPVLHGSFGEDGTLQGLLELAMVPYVGAGVLGSSVGMDKDVAKRLLRDEGIPVVPWITVYKTEWKNESERIVENIISTFGFPVFAKPANAGSSVGVARIADAASLGDGITNAFKFDVKVIIEPGIQCREIECAVLGNRNPEASITGEVVPVHEFYSYEAKYIDAEGAELKIPAEVDKELEEEIRAAAIRGYQVLQCSGLARVDFFIDKKNNAFYLNEINTLPGFTSISMYPKLLDNMGIPYPELLDRLLQLAFERFNERKEIFTIGN
ncbi:MAG: D-alanine--D-alanine ligase family protein [Spirochaetota bacterium]